MRVLYSYAASAEGEAVSRWLPDGLQIGVGKVAAAVSVAERLVRGPRPDLLCLFGVCGAYPEAAQGLCVHDLCMVSSDQLADEGVRSDNKFTDITELDLGMVGPFAMDEEYTREAASFLGGVPIVPGATVSTCSGTDALSKELQARSGAAVESMEGAAVSLVCLRHGIPMVQLRCVSNRTGNRENAGFDLEGAIGHLHRAVMVLVEKGWR